MKLFLAIGALAFGLLSSGAFAQPQSTAEFDALQAQRMAFLQRGGDLVLDVDALQPQEIVPGRDGRPFRQVAGWRRALSQKAVDEAIAYVKPFNTQALLVWHKGALQLEWYGEGFDRNSRSSPASMMKPVMALAMGAAIDAGKIKSIDDPVGAYIDEWKNDPRGAITLRQVLQMSTGLAFDSSRDPNARPMRLLMGTDIQGVTLETPMAKAPGAEFQYNNFNSQVGGLIIERATGMRFSQWLSRSVWTPIDARDASVWLDRPGGMARTYCCLIATAQDWLRVGLLIKNEGRARGRQIVSKAFIRDMLTPSPLNANFGFQVWFGAPWVQQRSYGPAIAVTIPFSREATYAPDLVFFDGSGGQRVYISRKSDFVIVRIGKSTFAWDDAVLPNIIANDLLRVTVL
jgi:CubicO group peptidase (beta-lactamase class C family)